MIQFLRGFISSKIGIAIALAFLVLIMLAFAAGDVANLGGIGNVSSGERVAVAGGERISAAKLEEQVRNAVENIRRDDPKYTMKRFVDEEDGVGGVLGELIDRAALESFGKDHGVIASPALVGRELARIPAFQGLDGKFSEAAYRQTLQQRGFTDESVRQEFAQRLVSRQLLAPAMVGAQVPASSIQRYAQVLTERRIGEIATLPALSFAPPVPPTEAEILARYKSHGRDYMLPERRVIRFATFDQSAVKNVPAPTEAEIAAVYKANAARFAATETRSVTQLILPTEAAARAVAAEVGNGKSLEVAASSKGLSTAKLAKLSRDALSGQASKDAAEAVFAASRGKLVGPVKSPLGWHLMRLDAIEGTPQRTLEQVRGEIVAQLADVKRRQALTDFSAGIEEQFDSGSSLGDVARELGLTLSQTEPLTADGQVFGKPGTTAPAVLAKVFQTAFGMEGEGQSQLAEIEPGKTFMIFDVAAIAPAAPAPLAAIAQRVAADVQMSKGTVAAREAAKKVEALVRKGTPLSAALASLGAPLPPVDKVDLPRQQLQAMGQQVPAPLRLLFMAGKGAVKLLEAPRGRGWYVVQVKDVIPGQVPADAPQLQGLAREMRQVSGQEYADALTAAIRKDVGVKRDEAAVKAVQARLKGN
jgi:peptidyl-prolyl cis-trans isomerase D